MIAPALILAVGAAGLTAPQPLDDSPSPRPQVTGELGWAHPVMPVVEPEAFLAMSGKAGAVEIRLNTTEWVGRRARIYLLLPQAVAGLASAASVRLEWVTAGRFSSGSVEPGQRALLYEGPIIAPVMGDFFDFTLHVDGRDVLGTIHLDLRYEIEPS